MAAISPLTAPAGAADPPARKSAPVDYVQVCKGYGPGFWTIPGSDTCMRLSGYVRAEFAYGTPKNSFTPAWETSIAAALADKAKYRLSPTSPTAGAFALPIASFLYGRDNDATGFRARARLNLDMRTPTDWGVARAYIRYEVTKSSGVIPGFSDYNSYNGASSQGVSLEEAFIEWNGFLAGRTQSLFDFYANELNFTDIAGSDTKTNQFRYRLSFGKGFAATLGIEDRTTRDSALYAAAPNAYGAFDVATGQRSLTPYWQGSEADFGGTRLPDIVAALGVEQDWGKAQVSGALHENRFAGGALFPYGPIYQGDPNFAAQPPGSSEAYASSRWGYAVQAGAKFDLSRLAEDDELWLQLAYADGATAYLGPQGVALGQGLLADQFAFPRMGVSAAGVPYFTGETSTEPQRGLAATAAFLHYWTPRIRQALFGSYLRLDNPTGLGFAAAAAAVPICAAASGYCPYRYGPSDTTVWQIGSNLIWSPVSGFDIGLELGYISSDSGANPVAAYGSYANLGGTAAAPTFDVATLNFATREADDRFYARLRLQRDF